MMHMPILLVCVWGFFLVFFFRVFFWGGVLPPVDCEDLDGHCVHSLTVSDIVIFSFLRDKGP